MSTFFRAYDDAVVSYFGATRGIYMSYGDVSVKILRHADYGDSRVIIGLDHGPDDDTEYFRPVMFTARLRHGSGRATFSTEQVCDRCGLPYDAPYSLAEHRVRRSENLCNGCRNYTAVKRHRFRKTEQGKRLAAVVSVNRDAESYSIDGYTVHTLSMLTYHYESAGRATTGMVRSGGVDVQIIRRTIEDRTYYVVRTWVNGTEDGVLMLGVDLYGDLLGKLVPDSAEVMARKMAAIKALYKDVLSEQAGVTLPF